MLSFLDLRKAFDSVNHDTQSPMLGITVPYFNGFIAMCLVEHTKCLSTLAAQAVCKLDRESLKVAF